LSAALDELAAGYAEHRRAFAGNGQQLAAAHREAPQVLMELIAAARAGGSHR
jgi:hypothetical protein